jgi:hypothetical protein
MYNLVNTYCSIKSPPYVSCCHLCIQEFWRWLQNISALLIERATSNLCLFSSRRKSHVFFMQSVHDCSSSEDKWYMSRETCCTLWSGMNNTCMLPAFSSLAHFDQPFHVTWTWRKPRLIQILMALATARTVVGFVHKLLCGSADFSSSLVFPLSLLYSHEQEIRCMWLTFCW